MSWYYAENNERRGPIEDAAFQSLVAAGSIKPDTLVWRDGMTDWVPYSEAASAVSAAATASTSAGGAVTTPISSAVACSQCGRLFPADETVTYEGRHICAECKPLFFQKVKEGALVTGDRVYAGFWIRLGAWIIDFVILQIVGRVFGLIFIAALRGNEQNVVLSVLLMSVLILINAAYLIYFIGKYGATPGKMACKIQVICADGSPMTFGRATGRYFAQILSGLTLCIGYLMVAWDEEKRALHDRICDTRVIRKP